MRKFGQLFASRESFAIMFRMAERQKQKNFKRVVLGDKPVVIDLRLLTTTTSKGI